MRAFVTAVFGARDAIRRTLLDANGSYGWMRFLIALLLTLPMFFSARSVFRDMLPEPGPWLESFPELRIESGKLSTEPALDSPIVLFDRRDKPFLVLAPGGELPPEAQDAFLILQETRMGSMDENGELNWNSYKGIEASIDRKQVRWFLASSATAVSVVVFLPLFLVLLWLMTFLLGHVFATMVRSYALQQGVQMEKELALRLSSLSQFPAGILLAIALSFGYKLPWLPVWFLLLSLPGLWNLTRGTLALLEE